MGSTFMGLETSKRGLYAQQSALYTTGHNISNANTEGYSRQRVNMTPTLGYPGVGLNTPKTAGYLGTGVEVSSVQRITDQFINRQYRQETNKLGYYESRVNSISQMEDIMSEPSEYGLNEAFNLFWSSLQDVSTNPEDAASRKVAIQRAEHLADTFNYLDTQLTQIQGNLGNEIDVSATQINSILKQIAEINKQVQAVEPNGYLPNDLYDARDTLLDQLNEYLPVSVTSVKSGGNALEIAEGSYTITFNGVELVNGKDYAEIKALDSAGNNVDGNAENTTGSYNVFSKISISALGNPPVSGTEQTTFEQDDFEKSKGKLLALIDAYGYSNTTLNTDGEIVSTSTGGYYPDMLNNLDKLSSVFVEAFNKVHQSGYPLDDSALEGAATDGSDLDFNDLEVFQISEDGSIKVNDLIVKNPSLLAASSAENEEGNGSWAIELSNLQYLGLDGQATEDILGNSINLGTNIDLDGATFQTFYESLIGQLGVDGQEAQTLQYNTETIRLTVQNNKASMSSVSLDEEMTNMITFQQAYNANARMITVIDETLDKIINGMGRVGI